MRLNNYGAFSALTESLGSSSMNPQMDELLGQHISIAVAVVDARNSLRPVEASISQHPCAQLM